MDKMCKRKVRIMRIGILGPGKVAEKMMKTLVGMEEVTCVAVGSRSLERAEEFGKKHGISACYGSYEELLSDPSVDLIYIATPHSHHYEHMKLCISFGKNILCEKAFTVNGKQAKEVFDLAREKNLLVVEGLWTRFLPVIPKVVDLIGSERLGKATSLNISMCHRNIQNERVYLPDLAGGTLLNLGVYVINFASMIFGDDVSKIVSSAVMTDTGVDAFDSITFEYTDGRVATMHVSSTSVCSREAMICCEKGYIRIPNGEKLPEILIYDEKHHLIETIVAPEFVTGFEYQLLACKSALESGHLECPEMPWATSLLMMSRMDEIRSQWGMVFPCE